MLRGGGGEGSRGQPHAALAHEWRAVATGYVLALDDNEALTGLRA
jgi:hypothetical protein